jgi:histidine triad (HIT) family protein
VTDPNCIFCKIIEKIIPSKTVYEDEFVVAFNDANPQAPVHLLVVPKRHIPEIHSITEADGDTIGRLFLAAKKIAAERKFDSNGYRMVINNGSGAGQTVFHVHLHILSGRRFSWPPG